jgi:cation diffusion facilitator family transporter
LLCLTINQQNILMDKFPDRLMLPNSIEEQRSKRNRLVIKATVIGLVFRCSIILFELLGVFLFNSSALFLDAIASLMDVMTSLFLILCLKLAIRPPDENHPLGHGRFEPFGGFLIGIFLAFLGGVMLVQQSLELYMINPQPRFYSYAWAFSAISMALLEIAYRFLIRIAKREHSPALAADAIHYRIDSLTSLLATIALILAFYFPEFSILIDCGGAISIAIFMIIIGIIAAKENFHQLMDRAPLPKFFELVRTAALRVKDVKGTEKIRIQQYGPDAQIAIDIEVDPKLTVEKAHRISQEVRLEIQKAWPAVRDAIVHIEPYFPNDH